MVPDRTPPGATQYFLRFRNRPEQMAEGNGANRQENLEAREGNQQGLSRDQGNNAIYTNDPPGACSEMGNAEKGLSSDKRTSETSTAYVLSGDSSPNTNLRQNNVPYNERNYQLGNPTLSVAGQGSHNKNTLPTNNREQFPMTNVDNHYTLPAANTVPFPQYQPFPMTFCTNNCSHSNSYPNVSHATGFQNVSGQVGRPQMFPNVYGVNSQGRQNQYTVENPIVRASQGNLCNLGTLRDVRVLPTYSKGGKVHPIEFLSNIEACFEVDVTPFKQIRFYLGKLFEHAAKDWFDAYGCMFHSYVEFKDAFLEQFWGSTLQMNIKLRLESGRYHERDGSFADYFNSKIAEARYLYPPYTEQQLITIVARHFPPNISSSLVGSDNLIVALNRLRQADYYFNNDTRNSVDLAPFRGDTNRFRDRNLETNYRSNRNENRTNRNDQPRDQPRNFNKRISAMGLEQIEEDQENVSGNL